MNCSFDVNIERFIYVFFKPIKVANDTLKKIVSTPANGRDTTKEVKVIKTLKQIIAKIKNIAKNLQLSYSSVKVK